MKSRTRGSEMPSLRRRGSLRKGSLRKGGRAEGSEAHRMARDGERVVGGDEEAEEEEKK